MNDRLTPAVQKLEDRRCFAQTPLPLPFDVSAAIVLDSSQRPVVEVTWNFLNKRETGFRIEHRNEDDLLKPWQTIGYAPANATLTTLAVPQPGVRYRFRVVAFGNEGLLSPASDVSPRINLRGPLSADNLTISAPGPNAVRLSWTDLADDQSGYNIERRFSETGPWQSISTVSGVRDPFRPFLGFTDTTVSPGVDYDYRITTLRNDRTNYSNYAAARTPTKTPRALKAPTNLSAAVRSDGIQLTWNDNTVGEDSYLIQRRIEGDSVWNDLEFVGVNSEFYFNGNVGPGVTYEYRVVAAGLLNRVRAFSNVAIATAG